MFLWVLSLFSAWAQSNFKEAINIGSQKIYFGSTSCSIPDSACECEYSSQVYRKNSYLPILHLVAQVDFYVGNIQFDKGELIIFPDDTCPEDLNKVKRIQYSF